MEFVLRYRGPLPSNGNAKEKHQIRRVLDPQLRELCRWFKPFGIALTPNLPEVQVKGRKAEAPERCFFFWVQVGGLRFLPLISRPHVLECRLDVGMLRREAPGAIIRDGGDLDNRLKTLFDALRMPLEASEVPAGCGRDDVFCLLEDDSLISHVSVTADRLLEPPEPGHENADVDLRIRVEVRSTEPIWGNLGI